MRISTLAKADPPSFHHCSGLDSPFLCPPSVLYTMNDPQRTKNNDNDSSSSSEDEGPVPTHPTTPVASMLAAEQHLQTPPSSRQRQNEDAFSSSSDDDDDDDDDESDDPPLIPLEASVERPSEWDKALRKGKPNTGSAPQMDVLPETAATQEDKKTEQYNPSNQTASGAPAASFAVMRPHSTESNVSAGVLPDVLIAMRQRIESLTLFDSDMMRLAATSEDDPMLQESIESLKRSFHQSISAAVLVSLSHKRYERRRLAAMEIDKVVRSLLHQGSYERVRAILLLLSDDYVRSTSEDARKGGVVALAACAVGMKRATEKENPILQECRDLILASVVVCEHEFVCLYWQRRNS